MNIDLSKLNYSFRTKPLLIGGKTMEYYGLRKAGEDIDFVIKKEDHEKLSKLYLDNIKDLFGDLGICVHGFEIWNQICRFDYYYLSENSIEKENVKIISLEKLLFLKALAIKIPKYEKDLRIIVDKILELKYKTPTSEGK